MPVARRTTGDKCGGFFCFIGTEVSSEAFSSKAFGDKIEKIYMEECKKTQFCDTL